MKSASNFSKFGFILSALGSAIGLGHIWRFPYLAGQNGGGAFVLLFLVFCITLGVTLLVGEMLIGNKGRGSVAASYEKLDPTKSKKWKYASLFAITGPLILTFYSVVLGWVIYYFVYISFKLPTNIKESGATFNDLIGNHVGVQTLSLFIVIAITAYFVIKGVKGGIEKLNYILMPLLFIIFIGLFFYAMTFNSFSEGLAFMFKPDFSKILEPSVLVAALSQMFFSLSLGAATMISYASETEEKQNLFSSALWIVLPGLFISLLAGVIIFTFVAEFHGNPSGGAGLVFVTLPLIFNQMGTVGHVVSLLFMAGLLFAGLTSTVSILEPSSKLLADRAKMSYSKATLLISVAIFIIGFFVILSMNGATAKMFSFFGKSLFDIIDIVTGNYLLTIGGLTSCVFIGWMVKKDNLKKFTKEFFSPALFTAWIVLIRFVAPIIILIVFYYKIAG